MVRNLLRPLFARRNAGPPARPGASNRLPSGVRRSASYLPLRPWQVRGRQFTTCRRGLDPGEVAAFLDRVAGDLAAAQAELTRSREETSRVKDALREWQSRQAPTMCDLARQR